MKHLKTYESSIRKLKVGDYILVKTEDNRIDNEVMIVTDMKESYSNYFMAEIPGVLGDYAIYHGEVLRRLTKEEAKMHNDVDKFNI